jgi:hypothetical protein
MGLFDGVRNTKPAPKKTASSSSPTAETKKKVSKKPVDSNYIEWEKELGFLMLIMSRKKNITKNYYINIFSTQLSSTDYIRDEDLEEIIAAGVVEVIKELSANYKEYLVTKYFSSESGLVKFITEEFYVDLTSAAINQNNTKIRDNMIKKKVNEMAMSNFKESEQLEAQEEENNK